MQTKLKFKVNIKLILPYTGILSLAATKVIMEMHNFNINAKNSENCGAIIEMTF